MVGTSPIAIADLEGLVEAWNARRLVLFLGAGVSFEWGIPGWKNLVVELLFEQTAEASRLSAVLPHYRRALAEWVTDYFDYDPVVLARVIKTDVRRRHARKGAPDEEADRVFRERVRERLYAAYHQIRQRPQARPVTTLGAVADLVKRAAGRGHVQAVVTFNFDDLLERALQQRRVRHHVIHDGARATGAGIPVIHPHGFLPLTKPPSADIVFTEDDYHRLTDSVFHWAPTRIVHLLRSATALFVGLSMSDPNLRRLLDASHRAGDSPPHWQIQKRHVVRDHERGLVRARVEERARHHAQVMRQPETKDTAELETAIDAVLRQADAYDRELFSTMGVRTIWLEEFTDLPDLLGRIGRGAR